VRFLSADQNLAPENNNHTIKAVNMQGRAEVVVLAISLSAVGGW